MSVKKVGVVLWILVLLYGSYYIYRNVSRSNKPQDPGAAAILPPDFDGRVFDEIAWKRLPTIKPFTLTEKSGEKFDSRDLAGKPYVLSFFFTRCPTICRDLNRQIAILANRYKDSDLTFIGLTVDAKHDTPEVLQTYAGEFEVDPEKWLLMTGQQFRIDAIARDQLSTVVDGEHHTPDIFLIDRWGRYRDRFTWDDPREMKRFDEVARTLLTETEPPLDATVTTRNNMAALTHEIRNQSSLPVNWLNEFQLTDQDDQSFHSRDLTGKVWVASLFFTRCGTICPRQNKWLAELQPEITGRGAHMVSISSDPAYDRPEILRPYARSLNAGEQWSFLTGDEDYVARVASEFLGVASHGQHHSSLLVVFDRWGNLRAKLDWQQDGTNQQLLDLIEQLNRESSPVARYEIIESESETDD